MTTTVKNDGFSQKLGTIEQALANGGHYISASLQAHPKRSLNLFCRWVFRPLCALIGHDTFAGFRAHAVVKSLLELCKANLTFLDSDNKTRVITIINTLNSKTKQRYHALINAVLAELGPLQQTALQDPPAAAAAAAAVAAAAASALPAAPALPESALSAPALSATALPAPGAPTAAAVVAVAVAAPAPSSIASAKVDEVKLASISDEDLKTAKKALTASTANLAYDLHSALAQTRASFAFSPAALADAASFLATTTQEPNHDEMLQAFGLSATACAHIAPSAKALKDSLKQAGVTQVSIYTLQGENKYQDALKAAGIKICQEGENSLSARKNANKLINDSSNAVFNELIPHAATKAKKALSALAQLTSVTVNLKQAVDVASAATKAVTFSDESSVQAKLVSYFPTLAKVNNAKEYTLIELPLDNGLSKVIILPNKGIDFSSLYHDLTPIDLAEARKNAQDTTVKLCMPAIATDNSIQMLGLLKEKAIVTDQDLTEVYTATHLVEKPALEAAAVQSETVQEVCIDRSFYWFYMLGDVTVLQGQFDSADAIVAEPAKKGLIW